MARSRVILFAITGKSCCAGSPGAKDKFLISSGDSVAGSETFGNCPEYRKAPAKLREAEQKQAQ